MRLLLCLLLLAASACGGGSDDGPRASDHCLEVKDASTKQVAVVQNVQHDLDRATGQGSEVVGSEYLGIVNGLKAKKQQESRVLAQIVAGNPDCFTVTEVAQAREALERSR
jgi:hypothetical protein